MEDITRTHALLSDLKLSRDALINQIDDTARSVRIDVLRNHSFELVASTIDTFLALSGLKSKFRYSDYDDAFSELSLSDDADLSLIWIDLDRYDEAGQKLLIDRFDEIAGRVDIPVLIAPVSRRFKIADTLSIAKSKLRLIDLTPLQDQMGDAFFEERLASFTGTQCSPRACLEASRLIGAQAIPAAVQVPLKAIIVDLDNTLYAGVLGEDGIDGVILTPGHMALQQKIEDMAASGVFVCVASKNEAQDAADLFDTRTDFPLKRSSITKLVANWDAKSDNIAGLETALNIHHSAMLFLDDNMGELYEVRRALPDIKLLWASPDADANVRALALFPGLERSGPILAEDKIRNADTQANEERRRRQTEMTPEDYLRSLEVKITFDIDQPEDADRVTALANKTNQFIFSYKRYTAAQIEAAITGPDTCVVTARMSDKLVDSGIIGVAVVRRNGDTLRVEEVFVSCRALGRGLDDMVVLGLIAVAQSRFGADIPLDVVFTDGARNGPARFFVDAHLSKHLEQPCYFEYVFPTDLISIVIPKEKVS